MTNKMVHHDRNGHNIYDIFHCGATISSLAKVVGLQSRPMKCYCHKGMKNIVPSVDKTFNMTAVVILVLSLIIFVIESLQLMLLVVK